MTFYKPMAARRSRLDKLQELLIRWVKPLVFLAGWGYLCFIIGLYYPY